MSSNDAPNLWFWGREEIGMPGTLQKNIITSTAL